MLACDCACGYVHSIHKSAKHFQYFFATEALLAHLCKYIIVTIAHSLGEIQLLYADITNFDGCKMAIFVRRTLNME